MLLIFGWGRSTKEACVAGLRRCCRCGNVTVHNLHTTKKYLSVYFMPVFKWGTKNYIVCACCGATQEVPDDVAQDVLRCSVQLPSGPELLSIWDELATQVVARTNGTPEEGAKEFLKRIYAELTDKYPSQHVAYVWRTFFELASDKSPGS